MTRLASDRLREIRAGAEAGSPAWRAALDRSFGLVEPLWGGRPMSMEVPRLVSGAVSLALALYIVAEEQGVPVGQVSRAQVEDVHVRTGTLVERARQWEDRLLALGVDLDDERDPLAAWWKTLSIGESPDWIDVDHLTLGARPGPVLSEGLDMVLAPHWDLRF